jgi:hypothetical protein
MEGPLMRNSHIEIGPIAGSRGAEIGGVNVAQDLGQWRGWRNPAGTPRLG